MKKPTIATVIIMSIACLMSFQPTSLAKPKLLPEIEKYYASLNASPVNEQHAEGIKYLTAYIRQANMSDKKIDLVFTCPDNSFRSITAQVILQSLVSVNKIGKLNLVSCGFQPGDINPLLVAVLKKHGFVVSETTGATGKKSYQIKFSEGLPSMTVFAKQTTDAAVPKADFLQIKFCSSGESNCSDLPGTKFKQILPANVVTSEEDADKEFTNIATDILIAFNKGTN